MHRYCAGRVAHRSGLETRAWRVLDPPAPAAAWLRSRDCLPGLAAGASMHWLGGGLRTASGKLPKSHPSELCTRAHALQLFRRPSCPPSAPETCTPAPSSLTPHVTLVFAFCAAATTGLVASDTGACYGSGQLPWPLPLFIHFSLPLRLLQRHPHSPSSAPPLRCYFSLPSPRCMLAGGSRCPCVLAPHVLRPFGGHARLDISNCHDLSFGRFEIVPQLQPSVAH